MGHIVKTYFRVEKETKLKMQNIRQQTCLAWLTRFEVKVVYI